jgi:hypothetical protein
MFRSNTCFLNMKCVSFHQVISTAICPVSLFVFVWHLSQLCQLVWLLVRWKSLAMRSAVSCTGLTLPSRQRRYPTRLAPFRHSASTHSSSQRSFKLNIQYCLLEPPGPESDPLVGYWYLRGRDPDPSIVKQK